MRELRTAPQLDSVFPYRLKDTFVVENYVGGLKWERQPRSQDIARSFRLRCWSLV